MSLLNRMRQRAEARLTVPTNPTPAPTPAPPEARLPREVRDEGVLPALIASDQMHEDNRGYTEAGSGLIHVSSLPDLCPRAYILAAESSNPHSHTKSVNSNDRIVWAMGRSAEKHVRDAFIQQVTPQKVYGRWLCPCERDEEYYDGPREHGFRECACERRMVDQYQEVPVVDSDAGIVGNCDLPYFSVDNRVVLTEIKSVKGEYFKEMADHGLDNMPTAFLREQASNHKYQITAYHRLFARNGFPLADYCRLLYVSKNYVGMRWVDSPYREYVVPMDSRVNARLDREWGKAFTIQRHRDAGTLPPRLESCTSPTTGCATTCTLAANCFMTRR